MTLDEIFSAPDPYGILDVKPAPDRQARLDYKEQDVENQVMRFEKEHGRRPDPNAEDIGEMILGTTYQQILHKEVQ